MKKHWLAAITFTLLGLVFISSCAKAEREPEDPGTETPLEPSAEFSWTPVGGSEVVTSNGYYVTAYNNIYAINNGNGNFVDIILDNLNTGAHAIAPSAGVTLEYATSTVTYTGKSGTVNITSKSNGKLSGTFSAALNGGTLTSISGEFINLPAK